MPGQIFLVAAVRGLTSEGERVRMIIEDLQPDIVAVSISRESLQAMGEHIKSAGQPPEPANMEEEMYIEGLSEFGDVIRPPPCFSEAWKIAVEKNIPIKAIDMDEEHFSAAFCKHISGIEMMRQGRCEKRWARHGFLAETPEDFVLEWDSVINWLPGYQRLERAREEWIAKGISILSGKGKNIVAVVELERFAGVRKSLASMGCEPQIPDSETIT